LCRGGCRQGDGGADQPDRGDDRVSHEVMPPCSVADVQLLLRADGDDGRHIKSHEYVDAKLTGTIFGYSF